MCDPVTIGVLTIAATVVTAGSQVYGGMVQQAQANYEAKVADKNAQYEREAAADAMHRREIDQMRLWRRVSQQLGDNTAKNAAAGLDVNFGSPAEAGIDILQIGMEDSTTLNENTAKEVKGYDINAANYIMQGRAAKARGSAAMTGAILSATGTLLSGASQAGKIFATPSASASFGPSSSTYQSAVNIGNWTG